MANPFLITENYKGKPTNIFAELYPDSAPENWLDILRDFKIPFCVSPLHDKDINENGENKKPHWHILMCWPGPTTAKRVLMIFHDMLHGPYPEEAMSVLGCYQYMIHQNNPEKFQYDPEERKCYNGFDPAKYDKLSTTEETRLTWWIQRFIDRYNCRSYRLLCRLLTDSGHFFEYNFLIHHTVHFKAYIQGMSDDYKNMDWKQIADYETDFYPAMVENVVSDDDLKKYTDLQLRRGS